MSACPTMDGFEVLRELRARGSAIPVIMLTARSSTRDTVEGLDSGANDYVPKPFTFEELLARVRSRLRETPMSAGVSVVARRRRARHPRPPRDRRTGARSTCRRASSPSPSSSCATRAGCSAASCCSAACGAWTSTPGRTSSTCTSGICAASSAPITSSPCAAPATAGSDARPRRSPRCWGTPGAGKGRAGDAGRLINRVGLGNRAIDLSSNRSRTSRSGVRRCVSAFAEVFGSRMPSVFDCSDAVRAHSACLLLELAGSRRRRGPAASRLRSAQSRSGCHDPPVAAASASAWSGGGLRQAAA